LAALGFAAMLCGLASTGATADEAPAGAGAAQAVQQAILAKPGGAEAALSLQDDPNVKSLLEDPSVLRAVRSGDLGSLATDGRVEALMRHPTVRALIADFER